MLVEHGELQEELADPALHADAARARKVNRRYAELNQRLRFERHDGDNRYGRNDRFAPGYYGR